MFSTTDSMKPISPKTIKGIHRFNQDKIIKC